MNQLLGAVKPITPALGLRVRGYLGLCKPRIVSLILFTALVGMLLAVPGFPPLGLVLAATVGIGLAASSAAALNHVIDRRIDERMRRTCYRPLPQGVLGTRGALLFAAVLGIASMGILALAVNPFTAVLTFFALIGYAVIYTAFLKHATPQNIVLGGAAGAAPPLLGWVAMTGHVSLEALVLVLIIFVWTPPHFWPLAIARREDYTQAGVPMLPVTHGVELTRLHVFLYTVLLVLVSTIPWLIGANSWGYLIAALVLGAGYLTHSWKLWRGKTPGAPMATFRYSLLYLGLLFAALLLDHYLGGWLPHI